MELVRWNPRREMLGMNRLFDRMFEDVFPGTSARGGENVSIRTWKPAVDIYDENDHVVLKAELPGVEKKDIEIDVDGRVLTLKGKRTADNEENGEHYYQRERIVGNFARSFSLHAEVNPDKIKAEFKDGILTLKIPKPEEHKPKKITVH